MKPPCSRTISNVRSDSWSVISGQYIFSGTFHIPSLSKRIWTTPPDSTDLKKQIKRNYRAVTLGTTSAPIGKDTAPPLEIKTRDTSKANLEKEVNVGKLPTKHDGLNNSDYPHTKTNWIPLIITMRKNAHGISSRKSGSWSIMRNFCRSGCGGSVGGFLGGLNIRK